MLNAHFMGILVVVLYYGMVVGGLNGLRFYFLSTEIFGRLMYVRSDLRSAGEV